MAEIVQHTYQFKRGTAQRWIDVNPILLQGEPGYETDTGKLKPDATPELKSLNNALKDNSANLKTCKIIINLNCV